MIPFLDLAADLAEVESEVRRRIDGVLARTQFVLGPETAELEDALRRRLGVAAAVAVSSGSDALSLALLALGIGPGDAVVLPSFTFFATAGAVVRAGAVPVFCDIDRATFVAGARQMRAVVDHEFRRSGGGLLHRQTGARLAALLPVHLYGRACEMEPILELARERRVRVIEDAAQAIGSRCGAASAGSLGDAGCFSFYPTKNLGGAGDGGLLVSGDPELGARVGRLRSHGAAHGSYDHVEVGINARMPELLAAVLNAKLARLDAWTARRRELAALYVARLKDAANQGRLELPAPCEPQAHVWHQFVVRIGGLRRDRVQRVLDEQGIATRVFYPLPLHLQRCFPSGEGKRELPESERAAAEVLCLPMYPSLSDEAASRVAAALVAALGHA